jgi:flagellar motor protein MotB
MARNPWEEEVESARGSKPAKRSFVGPTLLGLFIVATITFVFGYYMPLYRAHGDLHRVQQKTKSARDALQGELEKTQRDLANKESERAAMEKDQKAKADAERTAAERPKRVAAELATSLEKQIQKGALSVTPGVGHAAVSIPNDKLFTAGKETPSAGGIGLLCAVGKAAGEHSIRVVTTTDGTAPPGSAKSPFEVRSLEAANVASVLVQKCKLSGDRVSIQVRTTSSMNAAPSTELEVATDKP